jgi:hypothetical protein
VGEYTGTAAKQLTFGELKEQLARVQNKRARIYTDWGEIPVGGIGSYRGYYEQLSLYWYRMSEEAYTVEELEQILAMTTSVLGYKGGLYEITDSTPVWLSTYGYANGVWVVGIEETDRHVLVLTQQE